MDGNRFDDMTRSLARLRSRRGLLRALGLTLGAGAIGAIVLEDDSNAAAVCRAGGTVCRKSSDCCSDVCKAADFTGRRYCACTSSTTPCGANECCTAAQVCVNGTCKNPTPTPTNTPTNTPTSTPTNTPTNTPTSTPTNTPTNTPTSTATNTPTNTPTSTPTTTTVAGCGSGEALCSGTCTSITTASNCGSCGHICSACDGNADGLCRVDLNGAYFCAGRGACSICDGSSGCPSGSHCASNPGCSNGTACVNDCELPHAA